MGKFSRWMALLTFTVGILLACTARAQTETRVSITAITPSVNTGQDYSPWLNDNLTDLVRNHWEPANFQYIDVTLPLAQRTTLTRVRLYDVEGSFADNPASIYALSGGQRTLLGTFTGALYQQWVELRPAASVTAEAIIVRKYCNNIPQKIQVFGYASGPAAPSPTPTPSQAVISFGALAGRTVGDTPFALSATSTNSATPITFTSSNPAVASVSNAGGQWQATVVGAGTTTITASQAASAAYLAAASVSQTLTVQAAPAPTTPGTPGTAARAIKFKQSLGINAFEWDLEDPNRPWEVEPSRLAGMKNFTGMRHYLDWERLESSEGSYTFNPTHSGGWNYDALYQRLKAEGIEVLACIKTLPGWLLNTWPADQRDHENVPVRGGADFSNPASYREQARMAFQFAARYGRNTSLSRSLVTVNTTPRWPGDGINEVKIGLNLITYMECDNERDKWWKGAKAYQTPAQYAANLSAFYDGHKNTLGAGIGVKNADPTMQVVMAGLAKPDPEYVKGMVEWCRQNRGYRPDGSVNLCWDIINYHNYSNDAGTSQGGNSTRGAAPEVSDAGPVARSFVQMARQYCGNMPVWITETGFDTNQGSPFKAIAIGSRSVQETQADWILRTALLYPRYGVERVFFYQLYDDNPGSATQFATMGLLNADRSPRLATRYLTQANQLLGEYAFKESLNATPVVDRYELNGQSAYALVVPDERGRTMQYTLNLGTASYADVYRPTSGSALAVQRVNLTNGQLSVLLTETPLFVVPAAGSTVGTTPPPTTVPATCSATGSILREQWNNVSGAAVTGIPVLTAPASTSYLTQFESSRNLGDNYGARIRGYLCPPQTGTYTFWIAGDDNCELWLSSDADPARKVRIASVSGYTNSREWNKYASQKSAPVTLTAGQRYYVEALHKEQGGDDYVAVAWQLPNGTLEGPIPGSRLSPYPGGSASLTATAGGALLGEGTGAAARGLEAEFTVAPNPFSSSSEVSFRVPTAGHVTLAVYDLQGRLVRQLLTGPVEAGSTQRVTLHAQGLPTGVYLVRLTTPAGVRNQRVVLAE
ncbi:T9SS type A sorting domain-containing protein [Hymenobacter sp. HSC-4F20]|uniref:T9SS type A sorting domain-containing protein n=1 Tax=Hymenobacter sp. HSC-4F20 TaxID=2864135 RepID=UPI001C72CD71|nr:T9SS type A sorting domain-containing protein [Hymenobacter sp. HSC-4F20]MBX0290504.1 T9SS type A sorting domain-containing protein [Hymenobacter sp. HSC-4F20]